MILVLTMTEDERATLDDVAAARGMTANGLVRAVLSGYLVIHPHADAVREVIARGEFMPSIPPIMNPQEANTQ